MKHFITLSLLLAAAMTVSCSAMQKFDRVGRRNGGYEGMICVESTTNEPMEITFPKRGFSRRVTTKKDRNDG